MREDLKRLLKLLDEARELPGGMVYSGAVADIVREILDKHPAEVSE